MKNVEVNDKGITLIALVITIIVLLILAGISIAMLTGDNGLLNRAKDAGEKTKEKGAIEKVQLMLDDYMTEKYTGTTRTLEEYLNEQKANGELDEVTNNKDGTITVEVDGYEITIKEDLSIISTEKAGGTRPTFEIKTTKTDGTAITGDETEKLVTINITNITEFGENYTIEVKDSSENILTKETNVVGDGQASYIINKSGIYTIIVTATKDGITKTTTKTENITVAKAQIAETEVNSNLRANGVIDIVWLDMNNKVIDKPISPANYLGGLTAIKYDGTNWVEVDKANADNSWYHYEAQTGTSDGKTSNWANARSSDSNAYFVWIPRYAYKITYFDTEPHANAYRANNTSTEGIIGYSNIEGIIAVENGTEKLVTGSEPTNVTGRVQTSRYADYIPHPAFQFGEETTGKKAGIWVGKYESSGSTSEVKITPNTDSLRSITVGNMLTACQGVKNTYNLTTDSHMMKNTEWGAVAYLAESKYGRNGTEIGMNSTNQTTGQGNYVAYANQSTTGNVYGIYDMNGTSWEHVAGVLDSKLSNGSYYNFTGINSKYYNAYVSYNESKKIKGDGIYETSTTGSGLTSWHQDYSNFVDLSNPVFGRGRQLLHWHGCR